MIDYGAIFETFKSGRLNDFYNHMYAGLLLYAARTLGEEQAYLAEDCVQDAVMNTYLHRKEFSDSYHWRSYLVTCVRNRALKVLRSDNARRNYMENSDTDAVERELTYAMIRQETFDSLNAAIQTLPAEYREIVELSFVEGLKNSEIAALLTVAEITVKKRKARLLALLRGKLGEASGDDLALYLCLIYTFRTGA